VEKDPSENVAMVEEAKTRLDCGTGQQRICENVAAAPRIHSTKTRRMYLLWIPMLPFEDNFIFHIDDPYFFVGSRVEWAMFGL